MAIMNLRTKKIMSAKEIKSYVMKANNWTTAQYNKEYDKLRNRVRAYEKATGRTEKIAVNELLYTTTRARQRYGDNYRESRLLDNIMQTPSISSGKSLSKRAENRLFKRIENDFRGLIRKSAIAKNIRDTSTTPQELYQRLTAYAEELREYKRNKNDEYIKTHNLPAGFKYDAGTP